MEWTGHVTRIWKMINYCNTLSENLLGRDHSAYLDVDGKLILQFMVGEWGLRLCVGGLDIIMSSISF
jgi:hypothetical protein